jgi:hypothetical protein
LIWRTHLQRQEYNLNQRARQLDLHEAHLHRCECRCDHREAEVRAARLNGNGWGKRQWVRIVTAVVSIFYFKYVVPFPYGMLSVEPTLLG